jgi:hypothetical protein
VRLARVGCLPVLALALMAGSAGAQAPAAENAAAASHLFDEAQQLMAEGKAGAACPKYAESQRLDPQLGTLLYLAECYASVGRTASAWVSFKAAVEIASQKKDPREAKARARLAELDGKLSRMTISVAPRTQPVEIRRDGELVGSAMWGSPIPVDPGRHTITARTAGYRDWSADIEVPAAGGNVTVSVPAPEPLPAQNAAPALPAKPPLAPPAAPVAAAAPPPPVPALAPAAVPAAAAPAAPLPRSGGGSGARTAGIVIVSLGGVATIVGVSTRLVALGQQPIIDTHCDVTRACDQTGMDAVSSARTLQTVSTVSLVVGLAGVGTGIVLIVSRRPESQATLQPLVLPAGGGLAWRRSF